jgi:hypothetical protein
MQQASSTFFLKHQKLLENLIKQSNRPNATVGGGSLADAITHTALTGELVGGSDHIQKGRDFRKALKREIKRIQNAHHLTDSERQGLLAIANQELGKLNQALQKAGY